MQDAKQKNIEQSQRVCNWNLENDDLGHYRTDCENLFMIIEGTPEENGFIFCCYCGGKLKCEAENDRN